jgi:hypothetical protein
MSKLRRIYLHALIGALGGWLGWMLFGELCSKDWPWHQQALIGGALIGACIGFGIAGLEALMDRSALRFLRYSAVGIILGGLGGAAGMWIGDWTNKVIAESAGGSGAIAVIGSVIARVLGWALFGLAVGISEGVAAGSHRKITYGAIGGSLGGALGGLVFGTLMAAFQPGETAYLWGQALGLLILGALIGALRALVEEVLKPAAIRVILGWQEGREYPVVKERTLLGRDESADILLLRDMAVAKRHALLHRNGPRFWLQRLDATPQDTRVNDAAVEGELPLTHGDRIQLGATVIRFLDRSAKIGQGVPRSE